MRSFYITQHTYSISSKKYIRYYR